MILTRPASLLQKDSFWRFSSIFIGLLGVGYFYRYFFSSGFSRFQGDFGDGRLVAVIAGYWGDLFTFSNGWRSLGIYYPAENALGYSDSLFLSSLFVAPLRWLGINVNFAFQLFLIGLSLISYFYFIKFLKLGFDAAWPIAITGAFVFTFSNSLFVASNHPQLLFYLLIPLFLYLFLRITKSNTFKLRSFLLGVFVGLITLSVFYIGFYLIISLILFLIFYLFLSLIIKVRINDLKKYIDILLFFMIGGLLILPLFLLIYLPVLFEGKNRSFEVVASYALSPLELFNISNTNYIWGSSVEKFLSANVRYSDGEYSMAPTWGLLLFTLLTLFIYLARIRKLNPQEQISLSLILTGIVLWLAPVQFKNLFLWEYFYALPGADAIRAIGRVHIFSTGLMILGLSIAASIFWQSRLINYRALYLLTACLAVVAIEQVNRLPQQNNFYERDLRLQSISNPPLMCESFVIVEPFNVAEPNWTTQMDSVVLAQILKIPTWNGYTGNTPSGWRLLNVTNPDYRSNVAQWKEQNQILDGCGIDLEKNIWLTPNELDVWLTQSTSD